MDTFAIGFDVPSLEAIVKLVGFQSLLDPEIEYALSTGGKMLVTTAQTNTWTAFEHPTGALADSIGFWVASPMEVDLTVGVPYGARREFGFSGMTDSLGRFFPNDPAKPYMQPAIDTDAPLIRELVTTAIYNTWGAL